ncbi:hypothetical protein [Sphingobium phenoxybenzoativorans]|uniref:hypothetical protein n=1 Tax=Sphingobium phenoxybenzoativorans TaxID=1592790 RepID=UPI00087258D2|nr:hypothetical protein [Sphingobium phenoxybenzoativorans]
MIYIARSINEANLPSQAIVNTIREPLLVLDADLRVLAACRYFYETFRMAGTHQRNDDNQLGKALGNLRVMERQGPQGHLR